MPAKKKSVSKKKSVKKKTTHKAHKEKKETELPKSEVKMEKILIENFVSLQKVMVNLSSKFENLSNQISKLLDLFEISAKALAEKDFNLEKTTHDTSEITKKMDDVLDQNKIIARGLTLMHEKMDTEPHYSPPPKMAPQMPPKQPGFFPRPKPLPKPTMPHEDKEGYHKSISSKEKELP